MLWYLCPSWFRDLDINQIKIKKKWFGFVTGVLVQNLREECGDVVCLCATKIVWAQFWGKAIFNEWSIYVGARCTFYHFHFYAPLTFCWIKFRKNDSFLFCKQPWNWHQFVLRDGQISAESCSHILAPLPVSGTRDLHSAPLAPQTRDSIKNNKNLLILKYIYSSVWCFVPLLIKFLFSMHRTTYYILKCSVSLLLRNTCRSEDLEILVRKFSLIEGWASVGCLTFRNSI